MQLIPRLAALLMALAIVVSACGGSTPDNSATPAADPLVAVDQDSPIETLLGVPVFDEASMNRWFRDLDVERQRRTAECMLGEGFTFHPQVAATPAGPAGELDAGSREYAELNGFGIISAFNAAEYNPAKDYTTANSEYLASLSEAELDAYHLALYGTDAIDQPGDDFGNEFSGGRGGCEGAAFDEVFAILGVLDELTPVADGYFEAFAADSRRIALVADYQRCMAVSGFDVADPEEARDQFFGRLFGIIDSEGAFESIVVPDGLPEPAPVLNGDVFGHHPKLTVAGQVRLDELLAEEIATAVAHFDCRALIRDAELAIQREYEADLAEEIGPAVAAALGES